MRDIIKNFQDLLSNIGGLGSFILLIGLFINKLVSYYVILLDTQDLIFSKEELNFVKDNLLKKLKTSEKEITLQNSNYPLFINDKVENDKSSLKPYNLLIINNNKNKRFYRKKNSISYKANNKIITEKKINHIKIPKSNSYNRNNKVNLGKSFFEIKDKNNNIIQKPIKKEKFSWFSYILYILFFKSKNSKIKYYESFRAQILSEENLMQNNFDIYKLLEYCNIKKIN